MKRSALLMLIAAALFLTAQSPQPSPGVNNYYYSGNWYYGTPSASPAPRNQQQSQSAEQPTKTPTATPPPPTPQAAAAISPSQPETRTTANQSPDSEKNRSPTWGDWILGVLWQINWSNWALVLVAAVAACVAIRTLWAIQRDTINTVAVIRANRVAAEAAKTSAETAKQSLDHMRESAAIELRAYVNVSAAIILNPGQPANRQAQVVIRNFGRTPAYKVEFWLHTWVEAYPLNCVLPEPPADFPMSREVLAPSRVATQELPVVPQSLLVEEEIQEGTAAIYVYGRITYRDIFKRDQSSDFRLTCRAENLAKGRLAPDMEGNEAT